MKIQKMKELEEEMRAVARGEARRRRMRRCRASNPPGVW